MNNFSLKQFIPLLILFAVVQLLGLYVTDQLLAVPTVIEAQSEQALTWTDAIVAVIALAVFILIVRKAPRASGVIMRIVLTFLVLGGSLVVFDIWFNAETAFAFGIALVLLFIFFNNVFIQNIAMIISLAGIGALFGLSIDPNTALMLLVILSLYDIWAVYKTGHMQAMAQASVRAGAIPGFVVPEFGKSMSVPTGELRPGKGYMMLGSGDIVVPLIFAASVLPTSLSQAIYIVVGACIGLLLMYILLVSQKEPRMMAALPPIATMSIIGYLISLL